MGTPSDAKTLFTELLDDSAAGRREGFDEVFEAVYDELRRLAHHQLSGKWRDYTIDTTALVNEVYVKLVDSPHVSRRGRGYFFGAAARAMRQVLLEAARRRQRIKRGAGLDNLPLDEAILVVDGFATELIGLDECLERLAETLPRQARVVECRFFGGLTIEETAAALDLSERTVVRDWELARAWLYCELGDQVLPTTGDGKTERTTS